MSEKTILEYTVTYLEQLCPARSDEPLQLPCYLTASSGKIIIMETWRPSAKAYRKLFSKVGKPFLWWERLVMSEDELNAIISDRNTLLFRLVSESKMIGFCEIEVNSAPATYNIAYFGLTPNYVQQGFGGAFMRQILDRIWAYPTKPARVTINTCSLDHPKALGFYQHMGFEITKTKPQSIPDPRNIVGLYD